MNKKVFLILIVVLIICVIIFAIINRKTKNENIETNIDNAIQNSKIESTYDEKTQIYKIYDSTTGEVLDTLYDEETYNGSMQFYTDNPNYRADPPASPE